MIVTIICEVLGEPNNGTTIAAMNLINTLKEKGHTVRIVCPDLDKKGKEGYYVVPPINFGIFNNYVAKNGVSFSFGDDKVLEDAIKDCDVVHIMLPFFVAKKAVKIAAKFDKPITAGFHAQAENVTSHFFVMNSRFWNRFVYKVFFKNVYSKVDAIHFPTQFISDYVDDLKNDYVLDYVISNGVNKRFKKKEVERPKEYEGKFLILFTGRLSKEKNHLFLIKAIEKNKYKDKIQLIFAGSGPQADKIRKLGKKLPNPPIVKFFSREEIVDVINYCDLYVHPSLIEIEAISCVEALTCGLVPVISNSPRSATNRFALHPMNLFNYKSKQDLSDKITYWIEHPEEKARISKEYEGFGSHFSFEKSMNQMEQMLLDAIRIHETKKNLPKVTKSLQTKVIYYTDELNDDFAPTKPKKKTFKKEIKYIHKNIFFRFFSWILYYVFATPIVGLITKIVHGTKIHNRKEVMKKVKKTGYFLYANHTQNLDLGAHVVLCNPYRKVTTIASEETFCITGVKTIVEMLGAIPVPKDLSSTRKFVDAIKYYAIDKKNCILVYPEEHIWPFATKIRNFGTRSFHYPVNLNLPCVVATTTYRPAKWPFKKPRIDVTLSGPFYPDTSLPRQEAVKKLRDEVYNEMKRVASDPNNKTNYEYIELPNELLN